VVIERFRGQGRESKRSRALLEPVRGVDRAVVLASFGLPVAPYDLEAMRIIAKQTKDIDTVLPPILAKQNCVRQI
jgi:hypothetical protein